MEGDKRIRGSNYTLEEKNLLIILINKKKHIIENKKTDAVSNADKENAWKNVAIEFNALNPANKYRDLNSLKKMYSNMKKNVRKEVAEEKIELFKTGGGPSATVQGCSGLKELTLETINQKTVTGLQNKFDSDNILHIDNLTTETEELLDPEIIYTLPEEASSSKDETWKKWKPENLKEQVSSPLKRKLLDENPTYSSKRRPAATTALNSSNISKLYCNLAQERLVCINIEKEILENKKKWTQEKNILKKQISQVDLQLKLEELKKINPNWVDNFLNSNKM